MTIRTPDRLQELGEGLPRDHAELDVGSVEVPGVHRDDSKLYQRSPRGASMPK